MFLNAVNRSNITPISGGEIKLLREKENNINDNNQ